MSDSFRALAYPLRRDVVALLSVRAMMAGEIASALEVPASTLSSHLTILEQSGLVSVEAVGTSRLYRINMSVAEEMIASMMTLFQIGLETEDRRGSPEVKKL